MGPVAHREQQRVIGNRLVLDLLDRVPAPHALRLGLGTGKMSWIGQYGVGQRRGEMLKRAGSCELHERRAPFGPRDRPSGPLLRRRTVVTGIARRLIDKDLLARMELGRASCRERVVP